MAGAVLTLIAGTALVAPAQPASAATPLIYATFKGDGAADQELWIYQSTNGGTGYSVLYDTNFRGPTGVLRDPSIIKQGSTYYVAYTVQSWTTNSTYFTIAASTDLRTWTNIARVDSGIADTRFTWAPEFSIEDGTVRVIASVSQTTCPSDCFKPYVYTAQNSGLTSWSGPTVMGGITGNHIDTFLVKSGSTYHAFTKAGNANIELWTSTSLTSGYAKRKDLYSGNFEGQSLVRMDDGAWRMYADRYTNGGIYTATSSDLVNWSALSGPITCSGCRHGTAIPQ
jgi:hypothetical protein